MGMRAWAPPSNLAPQGVIILDMPAPSPGWRTHAGSIVLVIAAVAELFRPPSVSLDGFFFFNHIFTVL